MAISFVLNPFTGNFDSISTLSITTVGTSPNANGGSISAGQVLTLQPANTSFPGVLTAADWNTFNNKQATITIGALDAQAANATGLALVSNVLSTQSADGTHPGMVNTTTQTFAGNKTFTGTISASNLSGTNTGDVTLATFGSTPANPGASLSGQVLTLQPADATHGGGVSTTTQTFAGNKTFTGTISASNFSGSSSGTNTGDVTLAAFGSTPATEGASLSGQVLTLQPADGTHGGGVSTTTQTFAGAKTFSTSVTSPIFSSSTANPASAGVVRLANADLIEWRNQGNSGNVTLQVDTSNNLNLSSGGLTLNGSTSGSFTEKAADTTTNYTVKWPSAQGGASTIIQNDGSGNLSWVTNPNATVAAKYTSSTSSVTNANGVAVYPTQVYDTNSAYNNSTGIFTAPVAGKYLVTAVAQGTTTTVGLGDAVILRAFKNGSLDTSFPSFVFQVISTSITFIFGGSTIVDCALNDTISVQTIHGGSTTDFNLSGSATANVVSFERVGT